MFVCIAESGKVETWLSHDSEHEVLVDGFREPGSYSRMITYAANVSIIDQLTHRADSCKQEIKYRCESSRLLENPGTSQTPEGGGTEDGTGPGKIVKALFYKYNMTCFFSQHRSGLWYEFYSSIVLPSLNPLSGCN